MFCVAYMFSVLSGYSKYMCKVNDNKSTITTLY